MQVLSLKSGRALKLRSMCLGPQCQSRPTPLTPVTPREADSVPLSVSRTHHAEANAPTSAYRKWQMNALQKPPVGLSWGNGKGGASRPPPLHSPGCPLSQAFRRENQQRRVWLLPRSVDGLLACPRGDSKSLPGSSWALSRLWLSLAQPSLGQPYTHRSKDLQKCRTFKAVQGGRLPQSRPSCALMPLLPSLPLSCPPLLLPFSLPLSLSHSSFLNWTVFSGLLSECLACFYPSPHSTPVRMQHSLNLASRFLAAFPNRGDDRSKSQRRGSSAVRYSSH